MHVVVCGWEGWWLSGGGGHNTGTMGSIDLYPLLRNYDVWGEIIGIN